MAASKTQTAPADGTVEVVEILDSFESRLVAAVKVEAASKWRLILSKVILGEVIGGMYDAVDSELPPLKDTATGSEKTARKDIIRQRIMAYILDKTGRYYSWSNLDAWRKAGVTNQTLPEAVRVVMVEDDSGDPDKATLNGFFGVWPLQKLGQIEDVDVRASLAERLAEAGITGEDEVEAEVDKVLGKTPEPREPLAASVMVDKLVKAVRKAEAGKTGTVEHIVAGMDDDDALALIDYGRIVWSKTKADPNEVDKDKRSRKRLEVFRAAIAQLADGVPADEDDGAEDGSEPVL